MSQMTRRTLLFTTAFLALHGLSLISFFVEPLRPVFFFILLGAAAVFAFWKPHYTAIPIILELLLDSSGHLFEWRGLSLRLLTLTVVLVAWLYHAIRARQLFSKLKTPFTAFYLIILAIVALAAYNGYQNGHATKSIIADAIPFLYLALWYPLQSLRAKRSNPDEIASSPSAPRNDIVIALILASFLGAAILSLITLFLFSSGLQEIHGPFYTWWRDWVAGKATSTGFGFFRIVTPLHLFLTALVPYVAYVILRPKAEGSHRMGFFAGLRMTTARWLLLTTILLVPVLNFSRIYFLAVIPATLVMAWKLPWKKVALTLILIGAISLAEYTVINLAVSRGTSFGFEFITKQSRGIIDPESEASASARAAILPHLIDKIKNQPFVGEGIGATATYYNPFLEKELTTPHLDWGYLELAVEFGIIAALFFLAVLLWLLWRSRGSALGASVIVFLFVTTLTAPALFHVYGIALILVILLVNRPLALDRTSAA
ncbi:MAG: O-antigen ligase family protein [Candidatus Magasanikbacteria bacterium]|nr:O-antigen ligase family protein [Candidatus Magasanikbacteria bacterium]